MWFTGLFEYADRPLVRVVTPTFGDGQPTESVVLDQVAALNLDLGVAFHDYLRMDVAAPFYFVSLGPDGYQDPTPGDVRVSSMVAILRPVHVVGGGGPGLGLSLHVDIPTGEADNFLHQPGVAGGGSLSTTYEGPWYTLTADLGTQINPEVSVGNLKNSDQFVAGGAFNVLPGPGTGITLESHVYVPFVDEAEFSANMPAEILLSLRHKLDNGLHFTFGGAAGLGEGASAARFRAFLGLGYAALKPPRQPDRDVLGTVNVVDKCPGQTETLNGWRDDDGCPDELGSLQARATYKGVGVDLAEIRVIGPDGTESFPGRERLSFTAIPGSQFRGIGASPDRCLYGENSATVGETHAELTIELQQRLDTWGEVVILDANGAPLLEGRATWTGDAPTCLPEVPLVYPPGTNIFRTPMGPGKYHVSVQVPGYKPVEQDVQVPLGGTRIEVRPEPSRVVLEKTRIVILDKVFFEFNKAVIKSESFDLLNDVAAVIKANGDIGRVQIEGHTDDKGNDAYNLKLSHSRAESVRAYLVEQGCDPSQLTAIGFGETKPIAPNTNEAGRSENRRVEFNLVDQAEPAGVTP